MNRAVVFISCGQRAEAGETAVANAVAEALASEGFEPYVATSQQTLQGLKENIFARLADAEYFLFIDFCREELAGVQPPTTYARAGRQDDARRIAAELERQPRGSWNALGLAYVYAALGDTDAAFRWLGYERHHAWVPWVRVDPQFTPLRDDPRFAELMRRLNLPATLEPQPRRRAGLGRDQRESDLGVTQVAELVDSVERHGRS